jgi:hypothetical protein
MTEDPLRDLTSLRQEFIALQDALTANDAAGVEAATDALRASLERFSAAPQLSPEAQAILRDITALSGNVADTLASRLRAFDMVIEALRSQEGSHS